MVRGHDEVLEVSSNTREVEHARDQALEAIDRSQWELDGEIFKLRFVKDTVESIKLEWVGSHD